MIESFIERNFSGGSLQIIDQANGIIESYQAQGFTLTLRQLYYQFVSRDLIANKQSEYKRLGSIINDARLAGLIDWDAIEDRTREVERHHSWAAPSEIIEGAARGYAEDLWEGQDVRVYVRIEKDALLGVIEPSCRKYRVPYLGCRGYSSQSELYAAGKEMGELHDQGIAPIVLYLGDHDPSGIDMTRDNIDRLSLFAGTEIEVRRIALNYDQVERYRPPPNPLKEKVDGSLSDSRGNSYAARFGQSSWELDALEPTVIARLIEDEVEALIDRDLWDAAEAKERASRTQLRAISNRWDEIVEYLGEGL